MFASSMSGNYVSQYNKLVTNFLNILIEEHGCESVIRETLTHSSTPPFTLMGIPGCHLNPVQAIEWAMWNISHPQLHHLFRRHRSLTQHHFKEMPIAKSCLCVNVVPLGARHQCQITRRHCLPTNSPFLTYTSDSRDFPVPD